MEHEEDPPRLPRPTPRKRRQVKAKEVFVPPKVEEIVEPEEQPVVLQVEPPVDSHSDSEPEALEPQSTVDVPQLLWGSFYLAAGLFLFRRGRDLIVNAL